MRIVFTSLLFSVAAWAEPAATKGFADGAIAAKSYSKLTFSPDGILFVGDSIGARIYAIEVNDGAQPAKLDPVSVTDLEGKIGALIGADAKDVLIHDMAVNPISKRVYLTASRGRRQFTQQFQLPNDVANASLILRLKQDGSLEEVRLDKVRHSSVDLSKPVSETKEIPWKKTRERVDAISDMRFHDGKLFVAGLSNEEFSSSMRVYPFPFEGAGSMTTLEIYHGAHGKWETDSPVRSFLPYSINGKPHIVASYLCTPLVVFPLESLKDKTHVKGATIAELGNGSYPVDMVSFKSEGQDWILIVNSTRGLMRVKASDLAKPVQPITSRVGPGTGTAHEHLRGQGVTAVENYGDTMLLTLGRNVLTGEMNLGTLRLQ